jgi:hypothetical protein
MSSSAMPIGTHTLLRLTLSFVPGARRPPDKGE